MILTRPILSFAPSSLVSRIVVVAAAGNNGKDSRGNNSWTYSSPATSFRDTVLLHYLLYRWLADDTIPPSARGSHASVFNIDGVKHYDN